MQTAMKTIAEHRLTPEAWRELARLVLASLATGALVSVVLALAVFLVATEARAAPLSAPAALAASEAPPV